MGGTLRTVVAAGKLAIPTSRGTLVSRTGLRERLSSDYRVALVSAPAGYGKTAALFVSINTLKSHVRAVYRKLGVASGADAVDVGCRLGVI